MATTETRTVTVTATIEELVRYEGTGVYLYWTPGMSEPYWSNRANFRDDVRVASPSDFAEAQGWDASSFDIAMMPQDFLDENGSDKCRLEVEYPF